MFLGFRKSNWQITFLCQQPSDVLRVRIGNQNMCQNRHPVCWPSAVSEPFSPRAQLTAYPGEGVKHAGCRQTSRAPSLLCLIGAGRPRGTRLCLCPLVSDPSVQWRRPQKVLRRILVRTGLLFTGQSGMRLAGTRKWCLSISQINVF